MVKAGIASGFDFLWRTSGIDVPFVLTNYTRSRHILDLFWVGVANTMLVTVIAIAICATLLGFVIGIARLSSHWLLSTLRRRLYRGRPQHPAAVLRAVLVFRRDRRPAGAARLASASSASPSSTIAA